MELTPFERSTVFALSTASRFASCAAVQNLIDEMNFASAQVRKSLKYNDFEIAKGFQSQRDRAEKDLIFLATISNPEWN